MEIEANIGRKTASFVYSTQKPPSHLLGPFLFQAPQLRSRKVHSPMFAVHSLSDVESHETQCGSKVNLPAKRVTSMPEPCTVRTKHHLNEVTYVYGYVAEKKVRFRQCHDARICAERQSLEMRR